MEIGIYPDYSSNVVISIIPKQAPSGETDPFSGSEYLGLPMITDIGDSKERAGGFNKWLKMVFILLLVFGGQF